MTYTKPQHFTSIDEALRSLFGNDSKIARTEPVAGGDINEAYRLTLTDGSQIFMKANAKKNASFFTAEAEGLSAIAQTGCIGTPRILCSGTEEGRAGRSFLLMEFIVGNGRISGYWETFAGQLAAMHRAKTAGFVSGGKYGFTGDNYIGAGRQKNTASDSWIAFFRDCRLMPQYEQAAHYFDKTERKKIEKLIEKTGDILIEPEYPSLLHGDLWSGNVITGNDGRAWLIDPAAYVGHAEADLAMTELFGGFPRSFYEAYREAASVQPGYEYRRDFYNLYHLFNHLNLFGRSYLSSVKRIVDEYVA